MKSIALIPARYGATRFPGKLMQLLGDKPIIRHTYENTRDTLLFDEVIVVTDDEAIFQEITRYGGYALMSEGAFESGSDRIASVVTDIDADIVLNVQGDEPFVTKDALARLLYALADESVQVASLMCPLQNEDVPNSNYVKVVVDKNNDALYFSRSPVPYFRNRESADGYMKHIGIYGYRKDVLIKFTQWEKTPLEKAEMLEQLRLLENGIKIRMVKTPESPVAIDTPEDLDHARNMLHKLIRTQANEH